MGHFLAEHGYQLLLLSDGMCMNINKTNIKDCAKSSCIVIFKLLRYVELVAVDFQAFKNKAK